MSPSSIETFRQCPLKYKLSRIDKLEDPPTQHTVLGNFVHSVMEDLFALPPENRNLAAARVLLAERWNNEYLQIAQEVTDDLKAMKWKAWWCVENYFEMEDPTKVQVAKENIETELNLVEVNGVPIKGYVDQWRLYRDGLLIRDWKTGKSPRPQWAQGKFFQLLIYADALSSVLGIPAKRLSLYYVADKVKLEKNVVQKDVEEMRNVVGQTRAAVLERCQTGEFEPTPNKLCNWCSYKTICPAF